MRYFILELVQSQLRFRGPKGMTIAKLDFATFTEGAMVTNHAHGLSPSDRLRLTRRYSTGTVMRLSKECANNLGLGPPQERSST